MFFPINAQKQGYLRGVVPSAYLSRVPVSAAALVSVRDQTTDAARIFVDGVNLVRNIPKVLGTHHAITRGLIELHRHSDGVLRVPFDREAVDLGEIAFDLAVADHRFLDIAEVCATTTFGGARGHHRGRAALHLKGREAGPRLNQGHLNEQHALQALFLSLLDTIDPVGASPPWATNSDTRVPVKLARSPLSLKNKRWPQAAPWPKPSR